MLCPNCNSENRDAAKFCDECGFPLSGAIARAAQDALDSSRGATQDAETNQAPEFERDPESTPASEAEPTFEPEPESPAAVTSEIAEVPEAAAVPAIPEGEEASEIEEAPEDSLAEAGATEAINRTPVSGTDDTVAIKPDFAGFDRQTDDYGERIASADYQSPEPKWRDGSTMQMPRVEGDEAPRSRDFLASSARKKSKKGRIAAIIIIALVALSAIIAFATYQMQLWGGKVVPDVTGMTEADARSVLVDEGFTVRSAQVKSDDTEGLVLIMDPSASSRADEGSEVVIHIATARSVPDVVGKSEEQAQSALAEEGYTNIKVNREHSDEDEGTVLEISPAAGERAKGTTEIVLTVAEPYTVPDVAGGSTDNAIAGILDAGLGYDIEFVNTENYPEGTVLSTLPAAGTKVSEGTIVIIQVAQARGAELEELATEILAPGSTVSIDGTNYIIETLDSVSYIGDDTVSYSATGRAFTYLLGETLFASGSQSVSGTIVFTEDNEIVSM